MLKKEVQVKIEGKYVAGSIKNNLFHTNTLINFGTKTTYVSANTLREIARELEELADTIDASDIATKLEQNDNEISDDDWGNL